MRAALCDRSILRSLKKRSAIGDRHFHGASVVEIGDHHAAAQWKRNRRRREILLIVDARRLQPWCP